MAVSPPARAATATGGARARPRAQPSAFAPSLLLLPLLALLLLPAAAALPTRLVLQHRPPNGTAQAVPFWVYPPATASPPQGRLPVIFVLNGWVVEAANYSRIAELLADRGYHVVTSDYTRPMPPESPPLPDTCPTGPRAGTVTSNALLGTFVGFAGSDDAAARSLGLQDIRQRGVVLLGHSMGGWGALELLAGECRPAAGLQATLSMCQGYSAEPLPAAQCGGDAGRGGLIRGAALWEGYRLDEDRRWARPGTFLAFMGSPQNNNTRKAFALAANHSAGASGDGSQASGSGSGNKGSSGDSGGSVLAPLLGWWQRLVATFGGGNGAGSSATGSAAGGGFCAAGCVTYAAFPLSAHFGINDRGAPTLCFKSKGGGFSDPPDYSISPSDQAAVLAAAAGLIDDHVRGLALGDAAARARLAEAAAAGARAGARAGAATPLEAADAAAAEAKERGAKKAAPYAPVLVGEPSCFAV
ncbi:hypothetical protein Rsub_00601 [Raphidocelis subcapitata]|uniref:AB hydrolase-1 domain-containing protein n=1 Tax=Raphidocelis subcapitata TaxID=307507 RepID=A0A2V0NLD6_9CHLO|nr:hypothetical protein Rsub_00601 [Raphidocelis subcapitata]|eukprot:GBF87889.1 hypothetical protein Rsub_00601 [Raphidocelis subcapitata]